MLIIAIEEVPSVYILPPTLFTPEYTGAEVEFPIYFNFFVKKTLKDSRVIVVGDIEHLDRAKALFKESVSGPSKEFIYANEEIANSAKLQGYSVDVEAECRYLAYKGPQDEPAPLDEYATFLPFTDGVATVTRTVENSSQGMVTLVTLN